KIIIGGQFTSYNGTARNRIARLNADGILDSTFTVGTGANSPVRTTSIQSDGKIIIGGGFFSYNGTTRNRIARLNADGTLDGIFTVGTGANDYVYTTSIQSDGKIIIGGFFTSYNGTAINYIARLNADGTLDSTFTVGTGADWTVETTSIQSDGKIIIGGSFTSYNGTARNRIARLNANGTLDSTFTVGTGANGAVRTTSIQSDGKIIIGGNFTSYNGTARNKIARLNADGTLDGTFTVGTGADSRVYTTSIQSDGKIIIGGQFTSYNGTARNRIARLNADGTLDSTFTVGTGASSWVYTTSIQSDGKIIIGGQFTSYNGTVRNRIARLNTDGTLDSTFTVGTGASSIVRTTSIQSDGKIIIGGNFTSYNGTARNHIARLNADGTLDGTFTVGTGASSDVYTTSIQSDGKIIMGGGFTSYNGTARNRIARINADGTLDGTFTVGTGANTSVLTTSIQSDGKIIIGGWFTSYNGTARNRIARLNADGTLDGTFTVGTGASSDVSTTSIQSDGKIIIGGWFTSYNGIGRNRIARLLNCFPVTTPATSAICNGDSIFLQGAFQTIAGTYYDTLASVNGCDSVIATTLTVNPTYNTPATATICSGDSILLQGIYQTTPGTYYDTLASLCGSDSVISTTLIVNLLPAIPAITQNGDTLASSTANSYQWYYYDTLLIGANSQSYIPVKSGLYFVEITDTNGCTSISAAFSVTISSIKEDESIYGLKIYPNPNTGKFNIVMNITPARPAGGQAENLELKIVNNLGQVLFREELKQFKGIYEKQLDLNKYPAGIYNLQLISKKGVINKQIIILNN
ncbi:MAG: T9SS type A sorting domain-containing protein, partial [Cytophagales bacterium]|nr:T9SS type A sorting domain-containing protein [Cytophagales bacterium]